MKDVAACDKLRVAGKQAFYPEVSEWGNPLYFKVLFFEYIEEQSKPRELKHLSTWRKRNQ
jgi:hypothetical protein